MRRSFVGYFKNEEELSEFAEWAFGEKFKELDEGIQFMKCWNFYHSDKLELHPDNLLSQDAPKMVELYREHMKRMKKNENCRCSS